MIAAFRALGAEPWSIVRSVVLEAVRPVLFGWATGSILAAAALRAKIVRTIACVIGVLAMVSLLAATARRGVRASVDLALAEPVASIAL